MNKVTEIVITKLDVLDGLKKVKVCIGYKHKGKLLEKFPYDLESITPVYKEFEGWEKDIRKVRRFLDLPKPARKYISFIEGFLGVKAKFISVGERREAILRR